MGIGEEDALLGEAVEIGSFDEGMTEAGDPVVHVVYGDK
jgi:hypothetical protein